MTSGQIRSKYTGLMKVGGGYFATLIVDHQSFVIDAGGGNPTTKQRAAYFRTMLAAALHRMAAQVDDHNRK